MANRTDPDAKSVHGTNPQNLVEKILRSKIYNTMYWKEHCFALTAEALVDKAVDLRFVGGTYGGQRAPTEFMCLMLKLLQLQPEKEIIVEFIRNEDYKYVRVLGAFYLRLVGRPLEVYQYLEPLYNDYRKVRLREADGSFALTHMDEVVDQLLNNEYLFDIALPRIPNRALRKSEVNRVKHRVTMERIGQLEPRISVLEDDFDEEALEAEAGNAQAAAAAAALEAEMAIDGDEKARGRSRSPAPEKKKREKWKRSRSRDRHRDKDRTKDRDRDRNGEHRSERDRGHDREPRDRDRGRERDRDRDRAHARDENRDRHRDRDDRKRHRDDDRERGGRKEKKKGEDVSIEETNRIRAELGLKPLK